MGDVTDFTKQLGGAQQPSAQRPAGKTPGVVVWYRVYCAFLMIVYAALVALGLFIMFFPEFAKTPEEALGAKIGGAIYFIVGIIFFIPFLLSFFFPNKPWVWIYGLVLICVGFTSCCSIPASIALLIFWIRPETKKYFGRA